MKPVLEHSSPKTSFAQLVHSLACFPSRATMWIRITIREPLLKGLGRRKLQASEPRMPQQICQRAWLKFLVNPVGCINMGRNRQTTYASNLVD